MFLKANLGIILKVDRASLTTMMDRNIKDNGKMTVFMGKAS